MARTRVGYVSYINTYPLIEELGRLAPGIDWVFAPPAALAAMLDSGEIDVGLAPVVAAFARPDYRCVSNAVIGCDGAVRSVGVFSRIPLAETRAVRLDAESRTSNVMARALLATIPDAPTTFLPPATPASVDDGDDVARLMIGNKALRAEADEAYPHTLDLGIEWKRQTGLPFVFAAWWARPDAAVDGLAEAFETARDLGEARVESIAARAASEHNLPLDLCRDYLSNRVRYRLTDAGERAIDLFRQRHAQLLETSESA